MTTTLRTAAATLAVAALTLLPAAAFASHGGDDAPGDDHGTHGTHGHHHNHPEPGDDHGHHKPGHA